MDILRKKRLAGNPSKHKVLAPSVTTACRAVQEVFRELQIAQQRWVARRGIGRYNEKADTPEIQRMLAEAVAICQKSISTQKMGSLLLFNYNCRWNFCRIYSCKFIDDCNKMIVGTFLTVFVWHHWRAEANQEHAENLQYYADFPQLSTKARHTMITNWHHRRRYPTMIRITKVFRLKNERKFKKRQALPKCLPFVFKNSGLSATLGIPPLHLERSCAIPRGALCASRRGFQPLSAHLPKTA